MLQIGSLKITDVNLIIEGDPVVGEQKAALTSAVTTLTCQDPDTPDYDLQFVTLTDHGTAVGFASMDEARSTGKAITNAMTRIAELEARLNAATGHGLIA